MCSRFCYCFYTHGISSELRGALESELELLLLSLQAGILVGSLAQLVLEIAVSARENVVAIQGQQASVVALFFESYSDLVLRLWSCIWMLAVGFVVSDRDLESVFIVC